MPTPTPRTDDDLPPDPQFWREELPEDFEAWVVPPQRLEQHVDAAAQAQKWVGLDTEGRRCFVRHLHTEVALRFDTDELPVEVAVGRERRIAWRLANGRWLTQVERIDHLDSCLPRHATSRALVGAEAMRRW